MSIFKELLNEEYDELLIKVLDARLDTRDNLMQDVYEKSIVDENLTEEQKNLVKRLNATYKFATLRTKYEPLSLWYIGTEPNLKKIVFSNKSKRLRRAAEDLIPIIEYLNYRPALNTYFQFPDYMGFLIQQYKYKGNNTDPQYSYGSYIIAALSKYCRKSYHDVIYSWYLAVFFRNIELYAITKLDDIRNMNMLEDVKRVFVLIEILSRGPLEKHVKSKEEVVNNEADNQQEIQQ